jgi:hypothetical protein
MTTHRWSGLVAALCFTGIAARAAADDDHGIRHRLAMRAIGVREALSEMVDDRSSEQQTDLFLRESHVAPPPGARAANDDWEDIRVPVGVQGQDLVFQEQFAMAGREGEFEDAAEKWLQRKVKGSDAAAAARGRHAISPRFAWDHGPIVGLNRRHLTVMGGADQAWVKWTEPIHRAPGWYARIYAGTDGGDDRAGFSIGRSLLHASRRR